MYITTDDDGILNSRAEESNVCCAEVLSSPRRHDYLLQGAGAILLIASIGVAAVSIG